MITHPAMRIVASEQSPLGVAAANLLREFDEQAREIDRLRADAAELDRLRSLDQPPPTPSARWAS